MSYVLDLFTPETWRRFRENGSAITGFRKTHEARAHNLVKRGDLFLCYLVKLSRWCGMLEVLDDYFEDNTPLFRPVDDPWVIRFKVRPVVVLDEEHSLPIRIPEVWNQLSRTRELKQNSVAWPGRAALQSSLVRITSADGDLLAELLRRQAGRSISYPLTESERKELNKSQDVAKSASGIVPVVVPESENADEAPLPVLEEARESIKQQAKVVEIGAKMGFNIWVPRADRHRIERELSTEWREKLLDELPLNFDRTTFKTVENIDVLWLRRRALVRAFEVEHTTAVYSGLLRMADLLALQPNIDIRLHIVAPLHRRDKVLDEIQRPVFASLEKPLAENCSFISYEALGELSEQQHLTYMTDAVLEEYEETALDL